MPPYSPELNPIEKSWANIKQYIRQNINDFNKLYDALYLLPPLCANPTQMTIRLKKAILGRSVMYNAPVEMACREDLVSADHIYRKLGKNHK